jgi:hypothetical protein
VTRRREGKRYPQLPLVRADDCFGDSADSGKAASFRAGQGAIRAKGCADNLPPRGRRWTVHDHEVGDVGNRVRGGLVGWLGFSSARARHAAL